MKRSILTTVTAFALVGTSSAVTVSMNNTGAAGTRPVGLSTGGTIASGTGYVALGTFGMTLDAAIGAVTTTAQWAAVFNDFTSFAVSNFSGVAGNPPSLFSAGGITANVPAGGPTDGAAVYFVAANTADASMATEVLVWKAAALLPNDNDPTAAYDFRLAADAGGGGNPAGSPLVGTLGNVLFGQTPLAGVLTRNLIPEPSTAVLAALSCGLLFRRRRK